MLELEKITEEVRSLALEIGDFLRHECMNFHRERVEKKGAHDYVSYVDKESERRIVARLREILPEAGFITEEGSASHTTEEYCWIVDPLDGTTNFIHGNAPFCVSIALRNSAELLVGVVYEVCRNECFWAWKGSPAFMNGHEIHVSSVSLLDESFIQLGFPYQAERSRAFMVDVIRQLYGHVGGIRVQGSAAAELCYVAAGRFEARLEAFLGPWDIAAGALIVQQAGGKLSTFAGGDDFYSGKEVLASNGKIHKDLLHIVQNSLYLCD